MRRRRSGLWRSPTEPTSTSPRGSTTLRRRGGSSSWDTSWRMLCSSGPGKYGTRSATAWLWCRILRWRPKPSDSERARVDCPVPRAVAGGRRGHPPGSTAPEPLDLPAFGQRRFDEAHRGNDPPAFPQAEDLVGARRATLEPVRRSLTGRGQGIESVPRATPVVQAGQRGVVQRLPSNNNDPTGQVNGIYWDRQAMVNINGSNVPSRVTAIMKDPALDPSPVFPHPVGVGSNSTSAGSRASGCAFTLSI